ncbi:class I SAM-dependent methyltransferase [Actinomycetospora aeridis]|uniref:Class I SAM-dependent methyltransferase n=1 Tax=Actinomycetospora aeridis TaxID=3129231 RepID=A0ABU8N8C3_9PSEU
MALSDMRALQEEGHGESHDYVHGSPHLKHPELRSWITERILATVRASVPPGTRPRVLEVGAGHGSLTEHLLEAGAQVVVTEMSGPSTDILRARFAATDVVVVHDPDGDVPVEGDFDVVVYLSVLHHIPDYLAAVESVIGRLRPGGAFVSFQDPLWYPRLRRRSRLAARGVYLAWRLGQGEFRRGLGTVARRLRGVYDDTHPSDMIEYHVMRQGVDERALRDLLAPHFTSVEILPYFSTQSRAGQRLGRRAIAPNTFGLVAAGRTDLR